MRLILICLAAVLLSGCGYIAGNKVEFESDLNKSNNPNIQKLAGKTFFITDENDYQRLVQLKTELRMLSYEITPNRFQVEDHELKILQITDQYYSTKTSTQTTKETAKRYFPIGLIFGFLLILAKKAWPKNRFLNPPAEQAKKENKIFGIIVGGLILTFLLIYLLI